MSNNQLLVGKIIEDIELSPDRTLITFTLDNGKKILAHCDADCCSSTWVENMEGIAEVIGSPVLSVTDLDMPQLGDIPTPHCPSPECVAYYGCKIATAKGELVIDFRNNSNGYYGGWMDWFE